MYQLAFDNETLFNLILYGIVGVMVAGSWAAKRINELRQAGKLPKAPGESQAQRRERLEAAANKRREDLRRMAELRRRMIQAGDKALGREPSSSRPAGQSPGTQTPAGSRPTPPRRPVQTAPPQRQPAPIQTRSQPRRSPAPARSGVQSRPPLSPSSQVRPQKKVSLAAKMAAEIGDKRAQQAARAAATASTGVKARLRQSLRDAVVFKEILDPPVSLREPQ